MRITTKGRYGLRAVVNLAMSTHTRPVSISTIAGGENVSSEFLEQIFYKLKNAGVIRSVRGPGGGFVLARRPEEITVKDILEAVGEMGGLTPCTLKRRMLCDRPDPCSAHDLDPRFAYFLYSGFPYSAAGPAAGPMTREVP